MTAKTSTTGISDILAHSILKPKTNFEYRIQLSEKLNKLKVKEFFPFENVKEQIDELQRAKAIVQTSDMMADQGYPELDYTFLSWYRDRTKKLPAFMVLDLNTNKFVLTVESMGGTIRSLGDLTWNIKPALPTSITHQYSEMILNLGKLSASKYDHDEIALSAEFHGVVPIEVRQKINQVLAAHLFDQIYIICEAPTWVINKTGRTNKSDPLVVGWQNETDQMFLIASFDISSLEDYVLTQFKK